MAVSKRTQGIEILAAGRAPAAVKMATRTVVAALGTVAVMQAPSYAQVVYSSNFASGTSGFTPGGVISTLTTVSLPTDGGGINSANQGTYLGEIGAGVAKSTTNQEQANLTLTGLTGGKQYNVSFVLFIGSSWDGYSVPGQYGPDYWSLTTNGTTLVNTTFSNLLQGDNAGAVSQQNYSPTTYTSALGTDPVFNRGTGAAYTYFVPGSTDYSQDYSIYDFGYGAGNPVLTFTANSSTETLSFMRYSGSGDSSDEYWALNNVQVSGVGSAAAPEPGALALLLAAALPVGAVVRRRVRWGEFRGFLVITGNLVREDAHGRDFP